MPGSRLERTHCVSTTAGLATTAAVRPSSSRRTFLKLSARLQSTHVSTSVKPLAASSARTRSLYAFSGSWRPAVAVLGSARGILLKPYAIATSSCAQAGGCSAGGLAPRRGERRLGSHEAAQRVARHDVRSVQDIGARRRHRHKQRRAVRARLRLQLHAAQKARGVRRAEREPRAAVDIRHVDLHRPRRQVRCCRRAPQRVHNLSAPAPARSHAWARAPAGHASAAAGCMCASACCCTGRRGTRLDGLHGEGLRAVLRKGSDHHVQYDVRLGEVRRGALDEHVARGELDSGVRAVDDRRQRQHLRRVSGCPPRLAWRIAQPPLVRTPPSRGVPAACGGRWRAVRCESMTTGYTQLL